MGDEIIDIVNESDEIIGKGLKSTCHKGGIPHRISAVLLFDSEGNIWLQKRSNKIKVGSGLIDCSASGHLLAGESYEEAAKKEMKEELGIGANLTYSGIKIFEDFVYYGNKHVKHFIKLFLGKYDGPFNIQAEELEDIQPYSIGEVKRLMVQDPQPSQRV